MTTTTTPTPVPARSDMPQECEDCGRSMTRCACCPARSDKDAEREKFSRVGWSVAVGSERILVARAITVEWADRIVAALAASTTPAGEAQGEGVKCAECGLDCAPGNCIYFPAPRGGDLATAIESLRPYAGTLHIADRDSYVVGFAKAVEQAAALARRATAAPSGESIDISKLTRWTFDGGMSAEARKDGQWVSFSDLEVLARRATAGPSSESIDLDKLEAVARKGFKARDSSGAIQSLAEIRDMISLARSATAGNAAPNENGGSA